MEQKQWSYNRLERIEATITDQTAEAIRRGQAETGLSIGELIDRMALNTMPREAGKAILLILENVTITISALSDEERRKALMEVVTTLVALLPASVLNDLFDAALTDRRGSAICANGA